MSVFLACLSARPSAPRLCIGDPGEPPPMRHTPARPARSARVWGRPACRPDCGPMPVGPSGGARPAAAVFRLPVRPSPSPIAPPLSSSPPSPLSFAPPSPFSLSPPSPLLLSPPPPLSPSPPPPAHLLPDDAARPHDAEPSDGLARREAVRPHHVERDERAGAPQAGAAVHGDGAAGGVGDAEEGRDDGVGRAGAILPGGRGVRGAGQIIPEL